MNGKATMFFLLNSLDIQRGGLTKASIMQANLFAELGYETFLLTFNFDARYSKIFKQMVEMGKIDKRITILNMYESLGKIDYSSIDTKEIETLRHIKENNAILDPHIGNNSYRVYDEGMYTHYIRYNEDDKVSFIDYFNEQRYRLKREDYDEFGHVRKVSHMDFELNKPRQMVFYDDNGKAYLSKWVNPKTGLAIRVNHFSNGELVKIFANDQELKTSWLESVIDKYDYPVMVSDARLCDPVMINVKLDKATKIWRLHSNHVSAPYDVMNGEIADTVATGLNAIDKLDAAFILSEEQKMDIENRFGKKNNLHVVPHYMDKFIDTGWFSSTDKDENLAVVVGRFSAIKRIDHTIKAFRKVVDQIPEARLELWGYGEEENNLKKVIKSEKLGKNVKIMGFTHDPSAVYEKALFSVLASKSEGFSLGIMESMANGVPMISYDIKYGAKDLIKDRETGWIVENANIDALADKMIWMYENKKDAIKMGKKAAKSVKERFNKQVYTDKWINIVDGLVDKKIESMEGKEDNKVNA